MLKCKYTLAKPSVSIMNPVQSATNHNSTKGPEVQTEPHDNEHSHEAQLEQNLGLDSRELGEEISKKENEAKIAGDDFPKDEKALNWIKTITNGFRKIGAKALNFLGFGGMTLAAISYIGFRFKWLAAFFAAPSLGAFFIANSMKKAAQKNELDTGMFTDPATIIKAAKENSLYLEKNFNNIIRAMVRVGEMSDKNSQKSEILADLKILARTVGAKRQEIKSVDPTNNELFEIQKFMDIYDSIKPAVDVELEQKAFYEDPGQSSMQDSYKTSA